MPMDERKMLATFMMLVRRPIVFTSSFLVTLSVDSYCTVSRRIVNETRIDCSQSRLIEEDKDGMREIIIGRNVMNCTLLCSQILRTSYSVDDETPKDSETAVKERHENEGRASIAAGASMMVLGIGLGILWGYMRFFRHGKLPRGGMTGNSGQILNKHN
ncbi:unnamed protein product [Trichogramma brassicae]|uniref:Uncharacterized protein n=1 Tax=Trichogramma brassicae TaxID=86971 RepID=A0A6H5IK42_9HYME|nr:unnamed protein product [Trichogramma brassicae]